MIRTTSLVLVGLIVGSLGTIICQRFAKNILHVGYDENAPRLRVIAEYVKKYSNKCGDIESFNDLSFLTNKGNPKCKSGTSIDVIPEDPWGGKYKILRSNGFTYIFDSRNEGQFISVSN